MYDEYNNLKNALMDKIRWLPFYH